MTANDLAITLVIMAFAGAAWLYAIHISRSARKAREADRKPAE